MVLEQRLLGTTLGRLSAELSPMSTPPSKVSSASADSAEPDAPERTWDRMIESIDRFTEGELELGKSHFRIAEVASLAVLKSAGG